MRSADMKARSSAGGTATTAAVSSGAAPLPPLMLLLAPLALELALLPVLVVGLPVLLLPGLKAGAPLALLPAPVLVPGVGSGVRMPAGRGASSRSKLQFARSGRGQGARRQRRRG